MTTLSFDDDGMDMIYEGMEFRLEKALTEETIGKSYPDVTDHEVLRVVEKQSTLPGEPRRVRDIPNSS